MTVHPDFEDFIRCLNQEKGEHVIVGAMALARLGPMPVS